MSPCHETLICVQLGAYATRRQAEAERQSVDARRPIGTGQKKNKKGSEYAEFNKTNKKAKSKSTFLNRVQPSFLTVSNRVQTPLNRV